MTHVTNAETSAVIRGISVQDLMEGGCSLKVFHFTVVSSKEVLGSTQPESVEQENDCQKLILLLEKVCNKQPSFK